MSRFVLLGLKTSGLKSLEHEVELQFYNHDLSNLSINDSLIKAIYGTNGEGKTAIALSLELYKNSIINGEYLAAQSFSGHLKELINQHTKKAVVDLYFADFVNDVKFYVFHHIIEYQLTDDRIVVSREVINECRGSFWGNVNNETPILETKGGEIVYLYKKMDKNLYNDIFDKTRNLLSGCSATFSIIVNTNILREDFSHITDETFYKAHFTFMSIVIFALSLNVFIDKEDNIKIPVEQIKSKIQLKSIGSILIGDSDDEISINEKEEYKKEISRIEKLLKVFKPDLDHIDIKYSDARGSKLIYRKTLVYKNGDRVDLAYESTGVKKLVRLFNSLSAVGKGGVVFIDEFDANIHDVYLCKLIEYFLEFTNGQFIFTTHNLGPMEVLDKKGLKHSIDFISKQRVTSWRRNGNYSVVKVYRNGMIPNSPFNIDSMDFIKVFGEKKNNG